MIINLALVLADKFLFPVLRQARNVGGNSAEQSTDESVPDKTKKLTDFIKLAFRNVIFIGVKLVN